MSYYYEAHNMPISICMSFVLQALLKIGEVKGCKYQQYEQANFKKIVISRT